MDPAKIDPPKLPDMVMCGDHPSITKTELNIKDDKPDEKLTEKEKVKERPVISYARLTPTGSRTERVLDARSNTRTISDHGLRLVEARRRVHSVEAVRPGDMASGNKALFQAALGSFRWPPYLVSIWVIVLLLTHALHCFVAVLDSALPNLRKFCVYFRQWTEHSWKSEYEKNRMLPLALACVTAMLYTIYFGLYALHALALWSIEPLCDDNKIEDVEAKVTNYIEEVKSKSNISKP